MRVLLALAPMTCPLSAQDRAGDEVAVDPSARARTEGWQPDVFVQDAFDGARAPAAFQANPADPSPFIGESGVERAVGSSSTASL